MRFKSFTAATLFGATLLSAFAPAAAQARDWRDQPRYEQRHDARDYDRRGYDRRGYNARNDNRGYNNRYRQPQNCKSSSTTGLLLGGVVGALLGRAVDTRGERTTGTVLGAGAGALLGNEVGKSC